MEYLRGEVVEKEEEIEISTIQTITLGGNSTQDVEVSQTLDAWPEGEKRVSLLERIKTFGQHTYFAPFVSHQP